MSVRKRTWTTRKGETREAWIVDYIDQNGKRHIETLRRKKEADAREAKVRIDIGKGVHVAPHDSITVAEAAENWIKRAEAAGLERATTWAYQTHTRLHILPQLGRIKLAKLSTGVIEKFRDGLLVEGSTLSRATARKVLVSLKALLKEARYGHLADGVVIKNGKRERRLEPGRDIPEPGEVKRLLAAANGTRQRALLLTAALTGLRASELRGLRWSDVDLGEAAELQVRQRADRWKEIGPPKSDAGTRTVPLPPELIAALKEWKLKSPKAGETGALVFPGAGGGVLHHSNMRRALDRLMLDAHVVDQDGKPKYGLHSFRHFFASWCINPKARGGRELPPKEAQRLLGHSSIVMTLDIYGHLFPGGGDRAELAEATAALLGGPPPANVADLAQARGRKA
jgi:integrase